MNCFKCSHKNSSRARYCQKCQAMLPKMVTDEPTESAVAIKEGVTYPEPEHYYETEQLQELYALVQDVLDGEDLFTELEAHLGTMDSNYTEFEAIHVKQMQQLLIDESNRDPDDHFNAQLSYVLRKGLEIFHQGRNKFSHFFKTESEDPDELEEAFATVGEGHDYICLGVEMAQGRLAAWKAYLENQPEAEAPEDGAEPLESYQGGSA